MRANLALINPAWSVWAACIKPAIPCPYKSCMGSVCVLPVWYLQQQALIDPVRDLYGFAWIWNKEVLPNGGKHTEEDDWLQLWITTDTGSVFIRAYIGKYAIVLINNWWHWSNVIEALSHLSFGGIKKHALSWGPIWLFRWGIMGKRDCLLCMFSVLILLMGNHMTNKQFCLRHFFRLG